MTGQTHKHHSMAPELRAAAFATLLGFATQFVSGGAFAEGDRALGHSSPGTPLPEAFQQFDANRDGVLSASERSALRSSLAGARKDLLSAAPVVAPAGERPRAQPHPPLNTARGGAQPSAPRGPEARTREASSSLESLRGPATARALDPAALNSEALDSAEELQDRRREVIESVLSKRNVSRVESHRSRVEREEERESVLTDLQAYRFVMKNKAPGSKAQTKPFRIPPRQGVSHGKKRGSKYYTELLRRTGRAGRRGGRYGNQNYNNQNYNF